MRQIINGKRYDTETAELIHEWSNGHYSTDFHYRSKGLWRTPAGTWFLAHDGVAMTDMATRHGDMTGGGHRIEPISSEDAFGFLVSHGGEDAAETWFADHIADA